MKKEIWKDIPDYEGFYMISSLGNVKSLSRLIKAGSAKYYSKEKILKTQSNGKGYLHVSLSKNGIVKLIRVHIIVAIVFLNHIPDGTSIIVDHENNIKSDNRISNLKLITTRKNTSKNIRKGTSKYIGVSWNRNAKKWKAAILIDKKEKFLGYFKCEIEASKAYQSELNNLQNGKKN